MIGENRNTFRTPLNLIEFSRYIATESTLERIEDFEELPQSTPNKAIRLKPNAEIDATAELMVSGPSALRISPSLDA